MKVKKINFLNLDNDTLKKVHDFSIYDADKIIINYTDLKEDEICEKLMFFYKVLDKLSTMLYTENQTELILSEDEEFWIRQNSDNGLLHNTDEIMDIIRLLEHCYHGEEPYYYFLDKIIKLIGFRKIFGEGSAYFNCNLEIEENKIES